MHVRGDGERIKQTVAGLGGRLVRKERQRKIEQGWKRDRLGQREKGRDR